jgi:potassium uptake TrkH family protein
MSVMIHGIQKRLDKLQPAQLIVSFYIMAVTISTILLSLPIALKPGVKWSFLDALFTAVSSISVTGLSVVSIVDTFSILGIFILMFVLQFGGIGIMTLGTFFWILLGRRIGLRERRLIMTDQNQSSLAGLVKLMKQILIMIFTIEIIGALILGTYLLKYYPTWQEAYLQGLFASISATTNAGFDITGNSLISYAHDYFVQTINIILLTLGAIGFPVLIEVKDYFVNRKRKLHFRFSLYTKLTTVTFFLLLAFGTIAIILLEMNHFFQGKSWHESFFYALFQSSTTKSAGLSTMNVNEFTKPTLLVISLLMFIGASPSSVGGGIRTTTFALNLLFLFYFARGYRKIKLFKRELHEEDVIKSLVVTIMAMIICSMAVIALMITQPFTLLQVIFEVCSAFGTNGLSMGITPDLSSIGKMIIIVIMFIGRIGILSFLFLISTKGKEPNFHYPKERIIIG